MPTVVLAIIGFMGGWCLCTWLVLRVTPAGLAFIRSTPSKALVTLQRRQRRIRAILKRRGTRLERVRAARLQRSVGMAALVVALVFLTILILENAGWGAAYSVEQYLIVPRLSTFVVSLIAGFACRAFSRELNASFSTLLDIALVSGSSAKTIPNSWRGAPAAKKGFADRNLPWSVQAGIFVAIVIVLVLAFNPRIFRNVTSFKAGGFEAHFASSTQWEIQAGQVAVVSIDRKNTLKALSSLDFRNDFVWRDLETDGPLNRWRLKFAQSFLSTRLIPIFKYLYCIESHNVVLSPEVRLEIAGFSSSIFNEISAGMTAAGAATIVDQLNGMKRIERNPPLIFYLASETAAPGRRCEPASDNAISPSAQSLQDASSYLEPDTAFHDKSEFEVRQSSAPIWNPYLIRAVATLMSYTGNDRHAESLIQAAVGNDAYVQGLPKIQRLSLWRTHLVSMVRSARPWPFDDMFDRMSALLHESRRQLDLHPPAADAKKDGPETINAYYRKARLDDLALGLQLFYQRALLKQRFTVLQLHEWSEWLKETRQILGAVENVGAEAPRLESAEREAWQSASKRIIADRSTLQDTVTAAALGSVLLPAQTGSPESSDCLNAKVLLAAARNQNSLDSFFDYNHSLPDEKETYKGWLEQVGTLINNSCD